MAVSGRSRVGIRANRCCAGTKMERTGLQKNARGGGSADGRRGVPGKAASGGVVANCCPEIEKRSRVRSERGGARPEPGSGIAYRR